MKHKTMWKRELLAGARPAPYWYLASFILVSTKLNPNAVKMFANALCLRFVKMVRGLLDAVAMTAAWTIPWYYLSSPVFYVYDALLTFFCIAYFSTGNLDFSKFIQN